MAIISGQQNVLSTVASLPQNTISGNATVGAFSSNLGSIFLGPSGVTTANGFELPPGQSVDLAVSNLNLVFVIAQAAGPVVIFTGKAGAVSAINPDYLARARRRGRR